MDCTVVSNDSFVGGLAIGAIAGFLVTLFIVAILDERYLTIWHWLKTKFGPDPGAPLSARDLRKRQIRLQKKEAYAAIREASENNQTQVRMHYTIMPEVSSELSAKGYDVLDKGYTFIRWND